MKRGTHTPRRPTKYKGFGSLQARAGNTNNNNNNERERDRVQKRKVVGSKGGRKEKS